jgi:hypothetical protein
LKASWLFLKGGGVVEESLSVFGIQKLKISGCMLIEDMAHVNGQHRQCILRGLAPLFYALEGIDGERMS